MDDLTGDTPIPEVDWEDVKFMFETFQQTYQRHGFRSCCFSPEILEQNCKKPENWLFAGIRHGLLVGAGLTEPKQSDYEKAASYPLPNGLAALDLEELRTFLL